MTEKLNIATFRAACETCGKSLIMKINTDGILYAQSCDHKEPCHRCGRKYGETLDYNPYHYCKPCLLNAGLSISDETVLRRQAGIQFSFKVHGDRTMKEIIWGAE